MKVSDDYIVQKRLDVAEVALPVGALRYVVMPCAEDAPERYRPLVLEGSAAHIWQQLAEPRRFAEVVKVLAVAFAVNEPDLAEDVRDFITGLCQSKLVETYTPEPSAAAPRRPDAVS